MRFNLTVLIGLLLCVVVMGIMGVLSRTVASREGWSPNDVYSGIVGSAYSIGSCSDASSRSNTLTLPAVSMRGGSMFRRRSAFSYAPAYVAPSSLANSQYPIGGTPSNSVASPMYTTSSAEFRSFGGGGNAGGVSMSGGSVKSSNSSVATASGLNVSMPSTSMYAYNSNRSSASDVMSSMSGDIAMASSQAYAGIGNTTGGGSRGMSGKRDVPSIGSGVGNAYVNILTVICGGSPDYTLTDDELSFKWSVYYSLPGMAPVGWDEFLAWYKTVRTLPDSPIGDVFPLLFIALIFAMRILLKSRKTIKCKFEN